MPLQLTAQHNVQASKLRAKIRENIHLAGIVENYFTQFIYLWQ